MPLPMPALDTRRWTDLVDEARALIPLAAPEWTDHNVHDPGITLIELFSWLAEQDIYRINRVPDRHRRKFLALFGFAPEPPVPARAPITFVPTAAAPVRDLPVGLTVATGDGATTLAFRTLAPLTAMPVRLAAIQVFDGTRFADRTELHSEGAPFPMLGDDPGVALASGSPPAFYVGLDFSGGVPVGKTLALWFHVLGGDDEAERARLAAEALPSADCAPRPLPRDCEPGSSPGSPAAPAPAAASDGAPEHHSARTVWEYFDGADWRALDPAAGEVRDETDALTLDGAVRIVLPAAMAAVAIGSVPAALRYLRCRLVGGSPDVAPTLRAVSVNTVLAEQAVVVRATLAIARGVTPPVGREPVVGQRGRVSLSLAPDGSVTDLAFDAGADAGPRALVLSYAPASVAAAGSLAITLVPTGRGTGEVRQALELPGAPLAGEGLDVWTLETGGPAGWRVRADLDASGRADRDVVVRHAAGTLAFGDGERGVVPADGAPILTSFSQTRGADGNAPTGSAWRVDGADDAVNAALLGEDPAVLQANLETVVNRMTARGGRDEETTAHAAGRAAEALWVHERLLEASSPNSGLDQLDPAVVAALPVPPRAVTLVDFERLALAVPGTRVLRARAWAGIDPDYPCLRAPGTVTVIVVPGLPKDRPAPSPGLLRVVRRSLDRRRLVGTRLVVVGPDYVEVAARAVVRALPGASLDRVRTGVRDALDRFLHPLRGGPSGFGWPFGRNVYRAEVLQVIDAVAGVDAVLSLSLLSDRGDQCGNVCVGPTALTTPGAHEIEVVA